jgi:hypothetical protein
VKAFERNLVQRRQQRLRDLEGLHRELDALHQAVQDQEAAVNSALQEGDQVLSSTDLNAYYENYRFRIQQISVLQKEELAILRRIKEHREEIVSLRQLERQIRVLFERLEQRRIRRRERRADEELLALGVSRTLLLGEATVLRVPVRIPSTRVSGRAPRENRGHACH